MPLEKQGFMRQADDPLDENFFALPGRTHQHYIATYRLGKISCFQSRSWYPDPIRHLVCQDNVSILKSRHHGRGNNPDRNNEKGAQDDEGNYKEKNSAPNLMKDPIWS